MKFKSSEQVIYMSENICKTLREDTVSNVTILSHLCWVLAHGFIKKNISRRFPRELLLCSPGFVSLIIQLFCKWPQLYKNHSILGIFWTSKNEILVSWARGNSTCWGLLQFSCCLEYADALLREWSSGQKKRLSHRSLLRKLQLESRNCDLLILGLGFYWQVGVRMTVPVHPPPAPNTDRSGFQLTPHFAVEMSRKYNY